MFLFFSLLWADWAGELLMIFGVIKKNLSYKKLRLHSRLVIRTSLSLILFGSLGFFITESLLNSQFFNDLNLFERLLSSIFETDFLLNKKGNKLNIIYNNIFY